MDYPTFFTTIFYYFFGENQAKNRKSLIRVGFERWGNYLQKNALFAFFLLLPLYDIHRIAITEKPKFGLQCLLIGFHDEFVTRKSAYKHQ